MTGNKRIHGPLSKRFSCDIKIIIQKEKKILTNKTTHRTKCQCRRLKHRDELNSFLRNR